MASTPAGRRPPRCSFAGERPAARSPPRVCGLPGREGGGLGRQAPRGACCVAPAHMSWVPPEAPRPQRPRGRCLRGQALCVALRTAHLLVCWPRICGRGGTRSSVKRVPEFAKGEPQGPAPPPQCGQRSCCLGCPAGTRGHGVPASTGPQPVRSSPLCSRAGGPFGACHRGGSAPLVTSPLTLLPRPGAGPRPEPLLLIRSRDFCGPGGWRAGSPASGRRCQPRPAAGGPAWVCVGPPGV